MSLINDALKRAKQAQQRNDSPPPAVPPLRPVEGARPNPSRPGLVLPVLLAAFVLLGGGLLMWMALGNGRSSTTVPAKARPNAAAPAALPTNHETPPAANVSAPGAPVNLPATKPVPGPTASEPVPPPQISPVAVAAPAAQTAIAPAPAPNPTGVSAEPPPPLLPRLQGIFYRPDRPSALLNGKTILVGGRSGDFLVVAITPQSVTLVRAGQTNVLSLPD